MKGRNLAWKLCPGMWVRTSGYRSIQGSDTISTGQRNVTLVDGCYIDRMCCWPDYWLAYSCSLSVYPPHCLQSMGKKPLHTSRQLLHMVDMYAWMHGCIRAEMLWFFWLALLLLCLQWNSLLFGGLALWGKNRQRPRWENCIESMVYRALLSWVASECFCTLESPQIFPHFLTPITIFQTMRLSLGHEAGGFP